MIKEYQQYFCADVELADCLMAAWTVTVINHCSQLGISDLPGFNFFLSLDFWDEDREFLFSTFCLESGSAILASLFCFFLTSSKRSCAFLKLNMS